MALQKQHQAKTMSFGEHRDLPKVMTSPSVDSGKMRRVNVNLDEETHIRFKTACAKNGTNISNVVKELVDKWLADKE